MKILIFATPRSGSGSLYRAIADNYFYCHSYHEPWGHINPVEVDPDCNRVVKTLIYQKRPDQTLVTEYDKIIGITRRDQHSALKSYVTAFNTKKWFSKYQKPDDVEYAEYQQRFFANINKMFELDMKKFNIPVWYYEDLFYNRENIQKFIDQNQLTIRDPDRFYSYFDLKNRYSY